MRTVRRHLTALAAVCGALIALPAVAEPIYGVTLGTPNAPQALFSFDSATPATTTSIAPISGLVGGQSLRGIDFRPSNGQLYAVSSLGTAAQLYTVNLVTGVLTTVGLGFTVTGNTSGSVSIDFNPVADALRVVTGSDQNYRVNANTGALVLQDTAISPASVEVRSIAYSNNVVGAATTTLYAYDFLNDRVGTIGSVNGSPNSPNGGVFSNVGSSGVVAFVNVPIGFDISGLTGIAYLALDDARNSVDPNSEFYQVNLATGATTLVGGFDFSVLDISVRPSVTVSVPEPETLMLFAFGLIPLAIAARRRRSMR